MRGGRNGFTIASNMYLVLHEQIFTTFIQECQNEGKQCGCHWRSNNHMTFMPPCDIYAVMRQINKPENKNIRLASHNYVHIFPLTYYKQLNLVLRNHISFYGKDIFSNHESVLTSDEMFLKRKLQKEQHKFYIAIINFQCIARNL